MHVKLVWPFIHLKSKRPQFGNNFSDNFFRQSNICSGIFLQLKLHRSDWYSCQVPTHFYHIWCNLFWMCSFTTVWKTFDGACFRLLGRWENTLLLRTQSNLSKTVLEIFGLPTQLSTPQKNFVHLLLFGMCWKKETRQERRSRDPEARLWISGTISAWLEAGGGRRWCLAGPPACASETSEGRPRLQL